jgi:hypothetical protein
MGQAALGDLDPGAVPADVHLAAVQGGAVAAGLLAVGPARGQGLDQPPDHLGQVDRELVPAERGR